MGDEAGRSVRTVRAHNTATASENKIHDDEVAASFGFRGGLVPGVDVMAYLVRPLLDRFGPDVLADGRLEARLAAPVFDGEVVRVESLDDGDGLALAVVGPDDVERAAGGPVEGRGGAGGAPTVAAAPLPARRPVASPASLVPGQVLGTWTQGFHLDRADAYLADVREEPAFAELAVAHPGWLLRTANFVLGANVRLGPWIHVASTLDLLGTVTDGAAVETRARVIDTFSRKGHDFVRLDVEVVVDDRLVMAVDHTAIYRPRQVQTPAGT